MVQELVEQLKAAASGSTLVESETDADIKAFTDKVAGLLKKHYRGKQAVQWWHARKYPGTMMWTAVSGPKWPYATDTVGIRVGAMDQRGTLYCTMFVGRTAMSDSVAVFALGPKGDKETAQSVANQAIRTADAWAKANGIASLAAPEGAPDSASAVFDGAKASTFGSRLTKALPGKLQSYTTLSKDREAWKDHKPIGKEHKVALWFGKSGKLTKDELGKLPVVGSRRLEAFYVTIKVWDGGTAEVIVTAKSGVYGDDWAKAIDKSDIEMRTLECDTADLLGSALPKAMALIADMYGDFAKKADDQKVEAGELNADTIGEKIAELWEMQREWKALRQRRADLIASHNAAMKQLEADTEKFESSRLKKVTDWMVKHGMKIVPSGTAFLVNWTTGRSIGADTPVMRAGAIAQYAKEKLGIDLPDSVTHKGDDGWKDPLGQTNLVTTTYFKTEIG